MKKHLLVIDDDAPVRESLKRCLEDSGYEVNMAADGQAALDEFASHEVDLVILDLSLPVKMGWEVFEVFTRTNPLLPVIIITGMSDQVKFAQIAGAGALLEKPIEAPLLLLTINELLNEPDEKRLSRLCGFESNIRYGPAARTVFLRGLRERATMTLKMNG
jgi:DNA-binding response OmpR family regulator